MYALIFIIQDKITADIEIYNKIFFKYFLIFIFKIYWDFKGFYVIKIIWGTPDWTQHP